MYSYITDTWFYFSITFGVMQFASFVMGLQGRKFYTNDAAIRKFSIMDLEFASNGKEIGNIIKGIYAMPKPGQSREIVKALRGQLLVDFLFMPGAYLSIFLLCGHVAGKFTTEAGRNIFIVLGYAQLLAWLCDILENIYLLSRIRPDASEMSRTSFLVYRFNEWIKWGLSLTGAVCGIFSMLYFWLVGNYSNSSFPYLFIILAEIIVFAVAARFIRQKPTD